MARLAGKKGAIYTDLGDGVGENPAEVLGVTSWEIDYKGDAIDVTGMDSSGAKSFIGGLTEWTATVECHWDSDEAQLADTLKPGNRIALQLYLDNSGSPIFGDSPYVYAIMTDFKPSVAVDGAVAVSMTLQGTGALSTT